VRTDFSSSAFRYILPHSCFSPKIIVRAFPSHPPRSSPVLLSGLRRNSPPYVRRFLPFRNFSPRHDLASWAPQTIPPVNPPPPLFVEEATPLESRSSGIPFRCQLFSSSGAFFFLYRRRTLSRLVGLVVGPFVWSDSMCRCLLLTPFFA